MEEEYRRLEFDQKWQDHFDMLVVKSRIHSYEVAVSGRNKNLNRYLNVVPYDRSRVKLLRADDTDYINANLVTVPKAARQYILTQGPLPETLGHFWLMVWEQKSNVLVMLNRIIELENFIKCEPYWPEEVDKSDLYEDVKLKVTLKSTKEYKHYTVREMILEDLESEKSRDIKQFQYKAWPDHGQPDSPTSFLRLLTAIRKSGGLDKMDEPTIVHCSAGIGRSGTFCLIDSVLSMVESQGSTEGIDIDNTLLEMRDYRMGLIQSPIQLRFAYMSIIYGIKILEKANRLHPHISSIKDSFNIDNSQKSDLNGSEKTNGKNTRRNKKKRQNSSNNTLSPNVFKKQLLVEALDDIDSDSAESLFYDAMKPWPSMKKARSSSPNDLDDDIRRRVSLIDDKSPSPHSSQHTSGASKAELLTNAINSLLTENSIATSIASSANSLLTSSTVTQTSDSVLLRRRERELKNQKIVEKTIEIKKKMKADELRRERYARLMSLLKKSAIFGGALVISYTAYLYIHGGDST